MHTKFEQLHNYLYIVASIAEDFMIQLNCINCFLLYIFKIYLNINIIFSNELFPTVNLICLYLT